MLKIAQDLLIKITKPVYSKRVQESAKDCLLGFSNYLVNLKNDHIKKDYLSNPDCIIPWVYGDKTMLKNYHEINAFCKCHLVLASYWLENLIDQIEKQKNGLTYFNIIKFKEYLHDFMFDVKPFVEYFERKKKPDFVFFEGEKYYHHQAWRIFRQSIAVYWGNSSKGNPIEHRQAFAISAFLLRQSLEIKFRRIIGIYNIYDKNQKSPKIRHDFFPEFIEKNNSFFKTKYNSLRNIIFIYKWTNQSIHSGNMPRVWEVQFAQEYCQDFFKPSKPQRGRRWSIHDATKIINYDSLMKIFFNDFLNESSENIWCIEIGKPEAVIESY